MFARPEKSALLTYCVNTCRVIVRTIFEVGVYEDRDMRHTDPLYLLNNTVLLFVLVNYTLSCLLMDVKMERLHYVKAESLLSMASMFNLNCAPFN